MFEPMPDDDDDDELDDVGLLTREAPAAKATKAKSAPREKPAPKSSAWELTGNAELDAPNSKIFNAKRMERVCRGAGRSPREMITLLEEHKRLAKMMGKMKGMKLPGGPGGRGGRLNPRDMQQQMQQMSSALPPDMLRMMGGQQGVMIMMKQFDGMDPKAMQNMMKGMM